MTHDGRLERRHDNEIYDYSRELLVKLVCRTASCVGVGNVHVVTVNRFHFRFAYLSVCLSVCLCNYLPKNLNTSKQASK